MKKIIFLPLFVVIFFSLILVGCGQKKESVSQTGNNAKEATILPIALRYSDRVFILPNIEGKKYLANVSNLYAKFSSQLKYGYLPDNQKKETVIKDTSYSVSMHSDSLSSRITFYIDGPQRKSTQIVDFGYSLQDQAGWISYYVVPEKGCSYCADYEESIKRLDELFVMFPQIANG